jgi:c(7)-type cytochrome triheme protein
MTVINMRSLAVLMIAGGLALLAMLLLASLAEAQSDPNRFNRLMKPAAERNAPPPEDGIHDPDSPGTHLLQTPREAFEALPDSNSGNYVQWNEAMDQGLIEPRNSLTPVSTPPIVLDLNIIREVKGSMPDVVYPHKQHTQWLDCSNCHPAIFIPQKGANQISMASILLGEKCGVCHGKVAFPVSECRRCHSRPKEQAAAN